MPTPYPIPGAPPDRLSGGVLRILDANANRASEGLRVVEDHLRFVLQHAPLAERCKQLRHALAAVVDRIDLRSRCQSRDAIGDVGRRLETPHEYERTSPWAVALASLQRVPQALRCLEEYGKLLDKDFARQIEQLRYECYELQRSVTMAATECAAMSAARLYVLADGGDSNADFRRRVQELVQAGVHAVQLRDKTLSDRVLLERARVLRAVTHGTPTLALINDRPDMALAVAADGVHLGQDDFGVREARQVLGPQTILGVSTHTLDQAQQAACDGADYIGVGPTFASTTKNFSQLAGLDLLEQVHHQLRLPAFAIGGVTLARLPAVLATGIRRVAVSAAIWRADDAAAQARQFLQQLAPSPADIAAIQSPPRPADHP